MKKILTTILILASTLGFSQKDTITQISTGSQYEFCNSLMIPVIENDTVASAKIVFNINRLAWGENVEIKNREVVEVSDSVRNLFSGTFNDMIVSTGLIIPSDSFGVYTLVKMNINYNDTDISAITAIYNKQEKSQNGTLTYINVDLFKELTQSQIDVFEVLLLSTEVKSLYLDEYNDAIGN